MFTMLLIIFLTVWVSLIVPKPLMFNTAVVGAFLAVGCALFEINSMAGSSFVAIVICIICLGIPVYRLYH